MDIKEAIVKRHSVRQYKEDPIPAEKAAELEELIAEVNRESGLHVQLIREDPECFDVLLASYVKLKNVKNYFAIVGPKAMDNLEETGGYYGQRLVLAAQMMGLNTCWMGGTFSKARCRAEIGEGEKIVCVIALGLGETQGMEHTSKPMAKLCSVPESEMPDWFREGVEAAMQAPTAMNQQKFKIALEDGEPVVTAGKGMMTKIDLGIVKYNFEAASGHKCIDNR